MSPQCKHGEFNLGEGCSKCVAERRAELKSDEEIIKKASKILPPRQEPYTRTECLTAIAKAAQPAPTAIVLRPGEDLEAHKGYAEALSLLHYAQAVAIKTADDLKGATNDLTTMAKLKRMMAGKKKLYLAPLKEKSDAIRATYEYLMAPVLEADKITRDKMLAYNAEQDRIRRQQEEINRKRMEAAEAEIKLKGELSEPVELVEVKPETLNYVRTDFGLAGQRDNWKYEVTDFAALPDEYKVADTAMLNATAKRHQNNKQVPGVRFYNEPIISVRAK